MSSPFGIIGLLFSCNFLLLIGIVAIDYFGMFICNLGEIIESVIFFIMILLGLIFAHTVQSGDKLLRLLLILLVVDLLLRWGLYVVLPTELTTISMEKIVRGTV